MAEEDAEIALLHKMQSGQAYMGGASNGESDFAGVELNTEHNNEHVKKESGISAYPVLQTRLANRGIPTEQNAAGNCHYGAPPAVLSSSTRAVWIAVPVRLCPLASFS